MTTLLAKRQRIETKSASEGDNDDIVDAIADLSKSVKDAQTETETKVAKMIADAIKPIEEANLEIQKKANRQGLGGWTAASGADGDAKGDADIEAKAFRSYLKSGNPTQFRPEQYLSADEIKTMTVGSDPDGGFTVFPVLSAGVTKRMFDQSPMRRLSRVETITTGDAWEEPIDTDDLGATWVAETEGRPETSTPQVGMLRVPVEEIYAMPRVSQRMLDDSSWKIGTWLENKVGDKFGRTEGYAVLRGDGVKKPRGILTYPTSATADLERPWGTVQTFPSGHATLITQDALKSLVWGLRAPYRAGASWVMNSNTASAVDKLKNLNGDYIWRDGMTAGALPSLLGYPVEIDENMPDVGAGAIPIMFGNFNVAYVIVDKAGYKLLQDPYTAKPFVLFYVYRRTGGALANSEAVKFMVVGT
jgi:HK97 family phage major capsid protein